MRWSTLIQSSTIQNSWMQISFRQSVAIHEGEHYEYKKPLLNISNGVQT